MMMDNEKGLVEERNKLKTKTISRQKTHRPPISVRSASPRQKLTNQKITRVPTLLGIDYSIKPVNQWFQTSSRPLGQLSIRPMIRLEVTSMPQGHLGLLLFMTEHHVFDQDLLELAPRASTRNLAYCIPPHPSLASPKRDRQDSAKAASKAATHIRKLHYQI